MAKYKVVEELVDKCRTYKKGSVIELCHSEAVKHGKKVEPVKEEKEKEK